MLTHILLIAAGYLVGRRAFNKDPSLRNNNKQLCHAFQVVSLDESIALFFVPTKTLDCIGTQRDFAVWDGNVNTENEHLFETLDKLLSNLLKNPEVTVMLPNTVCEFYDETYYGQIPDNVLVEKWHFHHTDFFPDVIEKLTKKYHFLI